MPTKYSKYFPNARELTLTTYGVFLPQFIASEDFQRTIPLAQLTKLTLNQRLYFDIILKLLSVIPNIHTLIFCSILSSGERDF